MTYNIYLVEDEVNLNQVLTSYLEKEGWNITSFLRGQEAEKYIDNPPHIWILDIMLPDIDGFYLIKKIKDNCSDTPVIFISARDKELDRVIGLEMGSEDYLTKPFLPRELVIRTRKLLERIYKDNNYEDKKNYLEIGSYTIDEDKRIVICDNKQIELSSKEFDILVLFAKNIGKAFSRNELLNKIWGIDYFGSDRVVDDLVRRVRKKVSNLRIETIYGYGYRMVK